METDLASELGTANALAGLPDFDALVDLHRPRIFRFLLASLRDRESAENLTQECFLRAYKSRDRFRGDASVGTWLMQIAANLVRSQEANSGLKFWRRTRVHADVADLEIWIPDRQRTPEQLALARQQIRSIWKAAASLSVSQRTVFLLRFVEDMDLLEIVAVTGMKEGTVKTHLFRALQTIRAGLEQSR